MNYNRNNQLTASKNELKEKTPSPNNTQTTPTSWARPGHPLAATIKPVILLKCNLLERGKRKLVLLKDEKPLQQ